MQKADKTFCSAGQVAAEKDSMDIGGTETDSAKRNGISVDITDADAIGIDTVGADIIETDVMAIDVIGTDVTGVNAEGTDIMAADATDVDTMGTDMEATGRWTCRYFSMLDRKFYNVNPDTEEYQEIEVVFDEKELREHTAGFSEGSDWMQYSCDEGAFHSLENLLDGNISGNAFDRARQLRAYEKIAANSDGTCGQKVHAFVCRSLSL